jgi:hypothetical protein
MGWRLGLSQKPIIDGIIGKSDQDHCLSLRIQECVEISETERRLWLNQNSIP